MGQEFNNLSPPTAEKGRVLLVEDDPALARLVRLILVDAGFDVSIHDSATALPAKDQLSVVLLDLPLAEVPDGLTSFSKANSAVPVVLLTSVRSEDVLAEWLQLGAFDILFKPFEPDDLEASVRAGAGVSLTFPTVPARATGADFEIDFVNSRLIKKDKHWALSYSEWRLLQALVAHHGEPVLYQELLGRIWGADFRSRLQFLRAWMSRLRRKVGVSEYHGVGYALRTETK
jgi:two-component system KDP operon response regulator KdpE